MSASNAVEFARRALDRGIERDKIIEALKQAGWPVADIHAAMHNFAAIDFPLAVPTPKASLSARETFNYLLLFSSLYWSLWHFVSLISAFIDRAFPDVINNRFNNVASFDNTVRWDVAVLVVVFPIFVLMSLYLAKIVKQAPEKRRSPPRKWLTYLTLFLAAIVLAGDFVSLIYNFLTGELTTRFILKVFTVAISAGGVFAYFFLDIKKDEMA